MKNALNTHTTQKGALYGGTSAVDIDGARVLCTSERRPGGFYMGISEALEKGLVHRRGDGTYRIVR